MKDKLRASDYRFILICAALLAGSVWFSAGNFYRAFPEASIDFRVNRDDARTLASHFLAAQGYDLAGYRGASSFSYDDDAKTFLEREAGLEQANQIMGTRLHLWQWSYRWFLPQRKEEYRAAVTTRGEVVGFAHEIPEDAARPAVTADQARAIAEDFLRTRMHRDPAALDFLEASDESRPHRVDRTFAWKERGFDLHDSQYKIEVTVLGNEPGRYREYLKIPDQWTRDYQRLRSKNEAAQTFDTAALVVLALGLVIVIVTRVRRQDIRWRRASMVGLIGTTLSLCSSLNGFPLQEFNYPTTDSYSSFLAHQLLQAIAGALSAGGLLFVLTAGAEPLYREMFGGNVSLGSLFTLRGLRTKRFFLGAVLGITLTGIFIAYQTAFYIIAYRFGAWSPADVPYSDLLNTRFPWLFVLFGGFFPAVSEEFLFRMFSIPFLRKLTRSIAIAVVLAGFIWGFGHAGYAQQPFYIRGLEVGIGGVALGIIMLRWGILPTLVWHYSVDAMYSAMLLLRSQSLYFRLSGAAAAGIIVLPVVVALAAYLRRGGFEPVDGLLNRDEPGPIEPPMAPAPKPEAAAFGYRPLSTRMRLAAAAICALGLALLLIPVSHLGDSPDYKLSSQQAATIADAFLRSQSLNPADYHSVTYPDLHWGDDDSNAGKYFLERRPISFAAGMFQRYRPIHFWAVRYFKSLDKDEVRVSIQPETGRVTGYSHTIPDDRPGADLPADSARSLAASFAIAQGRAIASMELKESAANKQKARRDHNFQWEAPAADPRNLDDVRYRVAVDVAGDRPSGIGGYWKIPEAYERRQSEQNFFSILIITANIAVFGGLFVLGMWLLVQNVRGGTVPWRLAIMLGLAGAALLLTGQLLSSRLMLKNYNTAIPFQTFQMVQYMVVLMSAVFGFIFFAGESALIVSCFPGTATIFRRASRRALGLDAGAALLAAVGLSIFPLRLQSILLERFHGLALFSFTAPDVIVSQFPALSAVAGAVSSALTYAAITVVLILTAQRLGRWTFPAVLVAAIALVPGSARQPGEFALYYAMALATLACIAVLFQFFARGNYLAYALILWIMALATHLRGLFGSPNPALQLQGWIVAAVMAVSVAWIMAPALMASRK